MLKTKVQEPGRFISASAKKLTMVFKYLDVGLRLAQQTLCMAGVRLAQQTLCMAGVRLAQQGTHHSEYA